MGNLNSLIIDEDIEEVEGLPSIEEDDETTLKMKKDIDSLFSSLEDLKSKYELKDYVLSHKTINKQIAQETHKIFNNFINSKRMLESFSEDNSRINYDDSIVFMTTDISQGETNTLTLLKEVFEKGLEECADFYDVYINKIRPRIENNYNEVYMMISENLSLSDLSSIIFVKHNETGGSELVNTFNMSLQEIIDANLETLDDSYPVISFNKFKEVIGEILTVLNGNKNFYKLTQIIADSDSPVDITTIYNTEIVDLVMTPKNLYSIFLGKGLWYYSNMETLLDYVVNLVNLKKYDYDEFSKTNAPLSSFLIDISQEIKEVKDALEFMLDYVNNIGRFIHLNYELFKMLK